MNPDGSRLASLTQNELGVLLQSRTDKLVRDQSDKGNRYSNYVVAVVEVLNAMLTCGHYGTHISQIKIEN